MIWKVADIIGLALLAIILGAFTYLLGRTTVDGTQAFLTGGSLLLLLAGSVLIHIVLALGCATLGALGAIGYRATH